MPRTIGCPNCPTKLKVPDDAGGRRAKCPKCGMVMTIPSGSEPLPSAREVEPAPFVPHTPEPPLAPPPAAKPDDSPPPVRARRTDDSDERPVPAARRRDDEDRPTRHRQRDDGDRHDGDTARLHKGWKSVALGYRMLGLGMLFLLLGVPAAIGSFIAVGGLDAVERRPHWYDLSEKEIGQLAIPLAITAGTAMLVGLFTFLAHVFMMGMPKDEKGGKGKGLAVTMFFLPFVGLAAVSSLILLPLFSSGIGTALNKPRLRKYGIGLFVWYAVGFILLPLLAGGAFVGVQAVLAAEPNGVLYAGLGAGVIALVLGLFVFFSIWGTFAGMRRGIQASIRERGLIGGQDPQPAHEPERKRRNRDDDESGRPRGRVEVDHGDPDDALQPSPKRAIQNEDDEDDRPKKRKRDEDDRPRKRR